MLGADCIEAEEIEKIVLGAFRLWALAGAAVRRLRECAGCAEEQNGCAQRGTTELFPKGLAHGRGATVAAGPAAIRMPEVEQLLSIGGKTVRIGTDWWNATGARRFAG